MTMLMRDRRRLYGALCTSSAIGAAVVAGALSSAGGAATGAASGTLPLRAPLSVDSERASTCPAGTPANIECHARQGAGLVRGLGNVTHSYHYNVDNQPSGCPAGTFRILATTVRLSAVGRGEVTASLAEIPACVAATVATTPPDRPFTITGGTGAFTGATGSGTMRHVCSPGGRGCIGRDTYIGTLVAPELEFDLTAPIIRGATSRSVRAPRGARSARVRFVVTARDAVDGSVRVTCSPRSGSLFRIGRTRVTCSARDRSVNVATARFTVTVRRFG